MAEKVFADLDYKQVVHKYHDTVTKVCIMRLNNWADAEDCFQNVFLRLYQKSPEFQTQEHLKAWLIRVAINECNNYISKNRRIVPTEEIRSNAIDFPTDTSDMSWALMKLPQKYRNVIYLYYCEQYKVEEIAKILSKNSNTVKSLLKRGREKLRSIYGGDDNE